MPTSYTVPLAIFVALLIIGVVYTVYAVRTAPFLPEPEGPPTSAFGYVDPWDYQTALMKASDQPLPDLPCASHGSILYYALILEELAEAGRPLLKAMQRSIADPKTAGEEIILGKLASVISRMDESATFIKGALKTTPGFSYSLSLDEAIELLDGVTDVQVVNSGFGLASGLPVQDAYIEVVSSNLSKVNPKTKKIDKTLDGKWIKGSEYRLPNLNAVLQRHLEYRAKRIKADADRAERAEDLRLAKVSGTVTSNG